MYQDLFPTVLFLLGSAIPLLLVVLVIIVFYFIYQFITMTGTPFKTMQAIYVYLTALIGLIFIALGAYGIIEHLLGVLLDSFIDFNQSYLVTPLSQIIVGLFVMVPHWMIGTHFNWKEKK